MPLRVLLIAPSADWIGGQSIQADFIVQGLQQSDAVNVSFQPINPRLPRWLQSLQDVKYLRTLLTFPLYCLQLIGSVRRCDVLHIFSASYLSFVLAPTPAILLGCLLGKKVLVNYHSGEAADHLRRWPSAVRTLRLAHQIVVPSGFLVRVMKEFGLKADVVCNAIDLIEFKYRMRSTVRPAFLCNRNFEAHYNVAGVLRAFSLIQKEVPEATLTVAGDGPQRDSLHALAAELRLRNTAFAGRVAPAAMPSLYDAHDIWLNASTVDNMPLSVLEAYASGVAVVSSDPGGIPDLVANERTGLLSPCNDDRLLADNALRVLRSPPLFDQLTVAAFAECDRYTWQRIQQDWIRVYRDLGRSNTPES